MAVEPITLTTGAVRADVRQRYGITLPHRTLTDWINSGLVTPSRRATNRGPGSGHLWSPADLARVRLVVQLRAGGVTLPNVRAALDYLDKDIRRLLRPGSTATLVVDADRRRAHIVRAGQPDVEVAPTPGQLRLRFGSMFEGIERAVKKAARAA